MRMRLKQRLPYFLCLLALTVEPPFVSSTTSNPGPFPSSSSGGTESQPSSTNPGQNGHTLMSTHTNLPGVSTFSANAIQHTVKHRASEPNMYRAESRPVFFQQSKVLAPLNQTAEIQGQSTSKRNARQLAAVVVDMTGGTTYQVFSKQELSRMGGCNLRDLRSVDPEYRYQFPVFTARGASILVSVEDFKAMIFADKVFLFGFNNPEITELVGNLREQLQVNKERENLPFELLALETLLGNLCKTLHKRFDLQRPKIEKLLSQGGLNSQNVKLFQPRVVSLFPQKIFLNEMQTISQEIRRAMYDVLVSDEDMAEMYLTAKQSGSLVDTDNHIEVEEIFENYLSQIEFLSSDVQEFQSSIRSTEELVQIELDLMRNRILQFELMLSVSSFIVGIGAMVTGAFGMNLLSRLEDHPNMFWGVVGTLVLGGSVAMAVTVTYFKSQNIL